MTFYYWRTARLQCRPLGLGDEDAVTEVLSDWPLADRPPPSTDWARSEIAMAELTPNLPGENPDQHKFRSIVELREDSRPVALTFGVLTGEVWYSSFEAVAPEHRRLGIYRELRLAGSRFIIEKFNVQLIWWRVFAGAELSEGVRKIDREMQARLTGSSPNKSGQVMLRMEATAEKYKEFLAGQPAWETWETYDD